MRIMPWVVPGLLASVCVSSLAFSGGTSGSGSPPQLQDALSELMMSKHQSVGQLFEDNGELGLGVKGELSPDLNLTSEFDPMSVNISSADFAILAERKGNIDALNTDGVQKSYKIEDGDALGTLILKDRREAIRSGRKGQ